MNKESAQKELDAIKDKVKELERIINEPSDQVTKEKEMSDFLFGMINKCEHRMGDKKVDLL